MRLALDATSLLDVRTGVGTFTAQVTERLAERRDIELTLFAVTWRGRGRLAEVAPAGARVVTAPLPARPLRLAWKRGLAVPIDWWVGGQDVVHGPNFVVPPTRAAAVVTVHDLTCVRFPELCTRDTLEYPELIRRAVARGAWVHTVSHAVATEVTELLGVPAERVRAVPNGIAPLTPTPPQANSRRFSANSWPRNAENSGKAAAGTGAPAARGRYVLGLGTIEPRKDFPTLVAAFDLLAADDPEVRLVIAGPDGWGTGALEAAIARARHRDRIEREGFVDAGRRAELLGGAAVLAYASIYEGFGLPVLEAQQLGTPVVASDLPVSHEVAGDGARYVPARDPGALADALASVLGDAAGTAILVEAGLRNVVSFSWDATVDGLCALYRDALDARGG